MIMEMWSPFHSQEVKEICANMMPREKLTFRRRAGLYGFWTVVSLLIPLFFAVARPAWWSFILVIVGIAAHLLYRQVWQRKQSELLCSTSWAKSRGITPDKLPLFKGKRR